MLKIAGRPGWWLIDIAADSIDQSFHSKEVPMSVLNEMKRRKDQVALEADKLLRVNRKQGEISQLNKQMDALRLQLASRAYELYQQGVLLPEDLPKTCEQMDGLRARIGDIQSQIEQIKQETLPPLTVMIACSICGVAMAGTAAFCPTCGAARSKTKPAKVCFNCGQSLPLEAKFCGSCGLVQPASAPTPATENSFEPSSDQVPAPVEKDSGEKEPKQAETRSAWILCHECGAEMPPEADFCPLCGTPST
jgi:RNA polymerase subunit RPABC4/transcription elongation factor Spt4